MAGVLRAAAAIAVVVVVTACSSGGDPDSEPASTSSADETAPATFATGEGQQLRLDEVLEKQVSLVGGGGPDWMGAGFGSLWVRRDNAVLDRIAPGGRVLAAIDAGIWQQPVCQGLSVTDVAVWGCATSGKLMRVDPETNEIVAIVPIAKVNEQGRLTPYDGSIWVLTGDGDELVPVSEQNNQPGSPIALDAFCTDVADRVVDSTLWVVCPYDNAALAVDLDSGEVTARVTGLPAAKAVSAADGLVWVCTDDGVRQIDPTSASVTGVQRLPIGDYCTVRLQGETLWVRTGAKGDAFVSGIDARTGAVTTTITAPGDVAGGDILESFGALWASTFEEAAVYKMRPPDG